MEKKVLYNVLREIDKRGNAGIAAPDAMYLRALESIGFISMGWETKLTDFGREMLNTLRNQIEKW